jgi:hypothetical protein
MLRLIPVSMAALSCSVTRRRMEVTAPENRDLRVDTSRRSAVSSPPCI